MKITCCPLSSGGLQASCSSKKVRAARKPHTCYECREPIVIGTLYQFESGVWDGQPDSFRTCLSCADIRSHFSCDGFTFGELWNDLEENFFPDMKAGGPCMEGLSPENKQRLIDRRMVWWEAKKEEEMENFRAGRVPS